MRDRHKGSGGDVTETTQNSVTVPTNGDAGTQPTATIITFPVDRVRGDDTADMVPPRPFTAEEVHTAKMVLLRRQFLWSLVPFAGLGLRLFPSRVLNPLAIRAIVAAASGATAGAIWFGSIIGISISAALLATGLVVMAGHALWMTSAAIAGMRNGLLQRAMEELLKERAFRPIFLVWGKL